MLCYLSLVCSFSREFTNHNPDCGVFLKTHNTYNPYSVTIPNPTSWNHTYPLAIPKLDGRILI